VTLLEPGAVPEGVFDAAVLLGMDGDELADAGGVYAGLVRDGGWLMGDDTRDLGIRAVLAAVAPGWERLDDGLWCVRVRRVEGGEVGLPPDDDGEPAHPASDALGDDIDATITTQHDPIHSGPDVDEVHEAAPVVAGAEGGLVGGDGLKVDAAGGHEDAIPGIVHGDGVELPIGGDDAVEQAAISLDAEATDSLFLGAENDGAELSHASSDVAATIAPKRRGGRPKGSKNKAKAA
jgi:hypothetical protein